MIENSCARHIAIPQGDRVEIFSYESPLCLASQWAESLRDRASAWLASLGNGPSAPEQTAKRFGEPTPRMENACPIDIGELALGGAGAVFGCGTTQNDDDTTSSLPPDDSPTPTCDGPWYLDADQDGDGTNDAEGLCTKPDDGAIYVYSNGDCDDRDPAANSYASEECDGIDNNCDSEIDEDLLNTFYQDSDQDDYGDASAFTEACELPSEGTWTDKAGDCDDANAAINPDATEICDHIDNDCDNAIDESLQTLYYPDTDQDDFGDPNGAVVGICEGDTIPSPYSTDARDCDDTNAAVNPYADEVCDEIDNNCNSSIDADDPEITSTRDYPAYYVDADDDGFGVDETVSCDPYTDQNDSIKGGDCDDEDEFVYPGAEEVAGNGIDDDCDGVVY